MARQSKKQRTSANTSGQQMHEWKGQLCTVVGKETVLRSDGTTVYCLKIAVCGMPLHQGLRLVNADEVRQVAQK